MSAGTHDIIIDPRGSYREHYTMPFSITGFEGRAEVRDRPEGAILYISVNEVPSADGYIVLSGTDLHIFFTDAATARLANVRRAAWDFFLENPNGEDVDKIISGRVTIDPSVTDPSND
jgi:hypothetical protein